MPYVIAEETFATKTEVTTRCREILGSTPDRETVREEDVPFLFDLLQNHDEWQAKAAGGVRYISTVTTPHGTRCFVLVRHSGEPIDISFPHAIRLLPSSHTADLLPQALRDFRNAARHAVRAQIFDFRDRALRENRECPYTRANLTRSNCAVDHTAPMTFDALLFAFCKSRGLNPLVAEIGSEGGTIAVFADAGLSSSWQEYHRANASLRLLSHNGNLQLNKTAVPWNELWA